MERYQFSGFFFENFMGCHIEMTKNVTRHGVYLWQIKNTEMIMGNEMTFSLGHKVSITFLPVEPGTFVMGDEEEFNK